MAQNVAQTGADAGRFVPFDGSGWWLNRLKKLAPREKHPIRKPEGPDSGSGSVLNLLPKSDFRSSRSRFERDWFM